MRTSIANTLKVVAFAMFLNGGAAVADIAKCPCTPPAQPNFPAVDREDPAAEASEMWVIFWRTMYRW